MRVLQSFYEPRPTTNPYVIQLQRGLAATPGVDVRTFSWSRALGGRYDVVHLHWPETLLVATTRPRHARKVVLFALWLLRLTLLRTPVVRTVHNLDLPQGLPRVDMVLLRLLERRTTVRIRLTPHTPLPAGSRAVTIAHGHYRDWVAGLPPAESVPGRLAYVGQVRRYKGVETLVAAYAGARDRMPQLSLEIGGQPTSRALEFTVRDAVADLPDVTLHLEHLDDGQLVQIVTAAELVVLPYRAMHNSGTVLYALSLGRPVLVPDNEVNRALSDEVGPGWVHRFAGELDAPSLTAALDAVRSRPPAAVPNLSRREWRPAAEAHVAAYSAAVAART